MTSGAETQATWWASLTHGGLLIAPARLAEYFPDVPPPLSPVLADRLRRDLLRAGAGDGAHKSALLDTVLEDIIDLKASWSRALEVDSRWSHKAITGETVKPRRVWHALARDAAESQATVEDFVLPVFVADDASGPDGGRLGVGRGRRPVSRVTEWLRRANLPVALLTNGRQWRLIHAGPDYDAWCEWDSDLWFEGGRPGAQLTALRSLLSPAALTPLRAGELPPLVAAILDSRRGQAELSSALGERVRLAVERLIQESSAPLAAVDREGPDRPSRRELYIAATRIVMRCVVILFAEARDLLPRDNVIYHGCYGLQGLRELLARLAGGRAERLRHFHSAWPRLLALFELIRRGSAHEALPIPAYGGGLFEPGERTSKDGVLRALAAFEDPANALSDYCIHEVLELLTVSAVRVRQGRSSKWVSAPVDFSDLSSEYIGILYEGLLDFELRRAPEDDAIVFLRIGDEPALPLSRLEQEMAPRRLAELIGKLKKSTKKLAAGDTDEAEEEAAEEDEAGQAEADEEAADELANNDDGGPGGPADDAAYDGKAEADLARIVREQASIWAEKAVKEGKLVPYPRNDRDPVVRERWDREVEARAKSLYRLVLPGQWYLVRWGGTRKGAGTFYTRPQLAVPTVRRTLQPLCYRPLSESTDEATGLSRVIEWTPRTPEEILGLKVCDPAMGSGSFLVASLRYITDALIESLHAHGRLVRRPDGVIVKLADGLPLEHPSQETIPVPVDHPEFDDRLRARLKRHVVEQCLYGVDLDPLAVELARMALWIETMDRRLPFGFLDHKLRCGNALVGTWFDRFQDYPVMAFERDDAGDKNHQRFVSHFREYQAVRGRRRGETVRSGDVWTHAWKQLKDVIKLVMREWIVGQAGLGPILGGNATPQSVHDDGLAVFRMLHDLPVHEVGERERLFRERIAGNSALERLRLAFDTWCAIWFWPGDDLTVLPPPNELHHPSPAARDVIRRVRQEHRFFHWELEFPDVFTGPGVGFDAIVGNPPWEIQKPNSKEFFSNIDPLYRTYGKQEALSAQTSCFQNDPRTEHDWLSYSAHFKSFSTWNKFAAFPFGDAREAGSAFSLTRSARQNSALHGRWRSQRAGRTGYADPEHPFRHQGSADINTYKMFVEAARALLKEGGYLGFITPSGIYTDKGSTELRKLLLDRSRWEWLFGFENRQGIFDIHRSFKFNPIIVRKGGETTAIRTAFMHRAVEDWQEAERYALAYPRARVAQFSPRSSAILEIRSDEDLQILEKIYASGERFGNDDGWGIRFSREFHMGDDAGRFKPIEAWRARGYAERSDGLFESANGIAFPFVEGRSIDHFRCFAQRWVSGKGRGARWTEIPFSSSSSGAQYLMALEDFANSAQFRRGPKVGFMDVTSATNTRTVIAALLPDVPTGHSVTNAQACSPPSLHRALELCSVANSFVFDYAVRLRLGGVHLSEFVMADAPLPRGGELPEVISRLVLAMNGCHPLFARAWLSLELDRSRSWRSHWAVAPAERLRLRTLLDAILAYVFGLATTDLLWVLGDCAHPSAALLSDAFSSTLPAKGFWRVDKGKDPELRHTVLTQVAFHDLQRLGPDAFLGQNDGKGWMIPETLRLADYGLGHDERAREHQPVASRLGPRCLPWQLEQGVDESWEECGRHAEKIEALLGGSFSAPSRVAESAVGPYEAAQTDLLGNPPPADPSDNPTNPGNSRKR